MNALLTLATAAPALGHDFWLFFADERGMLPQFSCIIPGNWRRFTNAELLGLLRAAYPSLTVTWCDWAERPRDFARHDHVLLVKVLGENGIPQPDEAPKKREPKTKRSREEDWDGGDVSTRKDWLWDRVRGHRDAGIAAIVASDAEPIDVKCCGIGHTRGSFSALELVSARDWDEGFTRLHEERRICSCCKTTLTYVSKRLLGGK